MVASGVETSRVIIIHNELLPFHNDDSSCFLRKPTLVKSYFRVLSVGNQFNA